MNETSATRIPPEFILDVSYSASNPSFSKFLPGLQIAIDSTSMTAFKECPRKYYLSIICGWQSTAPKVDLEFGLMLHAGVEAYHRARATGLPHETSVRRAVHRALRDSWDKTLKRPWQSDHETKNRRSLLLTLVDYLDKYGENDNIKTAIGADGQPLVEQHFMFDLGIRSHHTGEPFVSCGYFDRIGLLDGAPVITDIKTTKSTISQSFWNQFTPHNQFSTYVLAGRVAFKFPIRELIVDAAQIAVGFTRFARHSISRDDAQIREFHMDLGWHIRELERCAHERYWPQRDTSCDKFGGCQFRGICSKSPASRDLWIRDGFRQRVWNPLANRGDI